MNDEAPVRLALPFTFARSDTAVEGTGVTTTEERVEGLLVLRRDGLLVQWRAMRTVNRYGDAVRTERDVAAVRETLLPLPAVAGVSVRASRWPWSRRARLTLLAADLRAFEPLAGPEGLALSQAGSLTVQVAADDRLLADEFAAELQLLRAERLAGADRSAADGRALPPDTSR